MVYDTQGHRPPWFAWAGPVKPWAARGSGSPRHTKSNFCLSHPTFEFDVTREVSLPDHPVLSFLCSPRKTTM